MSLRQWRAEGGADGATAPGIHPGGHPRGQFYVKNVGKWKKMKRKMSLPGHDAAREGASRGELS